MVSSVMVTNINTTFLHNNGFAGVLFGEDNVEIINIGSVYMYNRAEDGGAILIVLGTTCINTDTIFAHNYASSITRSSNGGAIHGRSDIKIINNRTHFINNSANYGGAMYVRNRASCINIDSVYSDNSGLSGGGAIYIRYNVELKNTGTRFISNIGERGAAIYLAYDGSCINTDCIFEDNFSPGYGGAMALWNGVKCTIVNCTFTKNKGEDIVCETIHVYKKNHITVVIY